LAENGGAFWAGLKTRHKGVIRKHRRPLELRYDIDLRVRETVSRKLRGGRPVLANSTPRSDDDTSRRVEQDCPHGVRSVGRGFPGQLKADQFRPR
jgi:hypothetical protein